MVLSSLCTHQRLNESILILRGSSLCVALLLLCHCEILRMGRENVLPGDGLLDLCQCVNMSIIKIKLPVEWLDYKFASKAQLTLTKNSNNSN